MRRALPFLFLVSLLPALAPPAAADQPQALSADIGGQPFVSDDDGIMLIPIGETFTLSATTAGASTYPPPKTRIDRLSITCDGYAPDRSFSLSAEALSRSTCDVGFTVGRKPYGEDPDAEFRLDKNSPDNRFEVTAARGKVIEGRFTFRLKDAKGTPLTIENGRFVAEDRQY